MTPERTGPTRTHMIVPPAAMERTMRTPSGRTRADFQAIWDDQLEVFLGHWGEFEAYWLARGHAVRTTPYGDRRSRWWLWFGPESWSATFRAVVRLGGEEAVLSGTRAVVARALAALAASPRPEDPRALAAALGDVAVTVVEPGLDPPAPSYWTTPDFGPFGEPEDREIAYEDED